MMKHHTRVLEIILDEVNYESKYYIYNGIPKKRHLLMGN